MQHIFDPKGTWFINTAEFPFVDPTNGCRFEPKVRTQAPKTAWLDLQSDIIKPEAVEVKAPAKPA